MINLKDTKEVKRKVEEVTKKRTKRTENEKNSQKKAKIAKKMTKKEQEKKKKWIKFLIKFIVIEYLIAATILLSAYIYSNIKNLNKLEDVIEKQQNTISYLINLMQKQEDDVETEQIQYLSCVEKNRGTFKVTAYCACEKCCGKWAVLNGGGYTASGTKVEEGRTIAVYPKQIPFGTEVHIEGMGTYIAEDTGSAIKENCIDIYFDSHKEALNFGVKYLEVEY